jgi:hypothetical protein
MTRAWAPTLSFAYPTQWIEASRVTLRARGPGKATITVLREIRKPGEGARLHADRRLIARVPTLEDFTLRESRALRVAGRTAQLNRYRFGSGTERVEQTDIVVEPEPDDRVILLILATAVLDRAEVTAILLDQLLLTAAFEDPEGLHTDPSPTPGPRPEGVDVPIPGVPVLR